MDREEERIWNCASTSREFPMFVLPQSPAWVSASLGSARGSGVAMAVIWAVTV